MVESSSRQIESRLIKRLLHACVRENLLTHRFEENKLFIPLLRNEKIILAENIHRYMLDKFNIDGEVLLLTKNEHTPLENIQEFLKLLHNEINEQIEPSAWEAFIYEIDNCKTNENIVAKYIHDFNQTLAFQMRKANTKNLFEYITANYGLNERVMFFERWAAAGHPYHPCHKTKLGFSMQANFQYSPEFHEDIHLPLAIIAKNHLVLAQEDDHNTYHQWFAEQFPTQWQALLSKLRALNLNIADFHPLFIHPWQYENTIIHLFADLIATQQLIFLEDIVITTKSSLSFRTLIATEDSKMPHIKLPVAVRSSSALRTISAASVENGPKLARILRTILQRENNFNNNLKIIHETCGLHIKVGDLEIEKHLGIIYRENPCQLLSADDLPIVVAALSERSPINGLPLFIEMIYATYGTNLSAAKDYFGEYSRIVVQAYFDLFLIYGIALEGHQQNTLAVFKKGIPQFMIARDFGGMCIHAPTFKAHGFHFQMHADTHTISNKSMDATNIFLHTVIQYHLGELIILLAKHYRTDEEVFWKIVKANLQMRFAVLKTRVKHERYQKVYHAILEKDWQLKDLMRMRLRNLYNKFLYTKHKNPLRELV